MIEFVVIDYMNVNEFRYVYKFVDFENSWCFIDYKIRMVIYINLDLGCYCFIVKVIN